MNHFEDIHAYLPESLNILSWKGFFLVNLFLTAIIAFRYFLIVAPFYFFFFKRKADASYFLHSKKLKPHQVPFEIKNALISSFIFAFFGYLLAVGWSLGWTKIYVRFEEYPLWYIPVSFLLLSLVHEFYFYFTHLWMHIPRFFKKVHWVHHYSNNTSPWASFSFHPYETLVHALFLPAITLIIPLHPLVLLVYLTFMTITAVSNHLGVELISSRWIRKFFISGSHHNLHHQKFNGNYGLYYCFLDRWMGTELVDQVDSVSKLQFSETKI